MGEQLGEHIIVYIDHIRLHHDQDKMKEARPSPMIKMEQVSNHHTTEKRV